MTNPAHRAMTAGPWLASVAAMLGVALTILPRLRWINIYEDQAVLSGQAMQTAAGQVPYRDFFAAIPPGAIFMYAGYFRLVGATVVHQRLLTGVAMVLGAGLVAHIGRRFVGSAWGAGIALLWGVWLPVFEEFSPYHFWSVALILAMAATLLAARSARAPDRLFVLAGVFAAAALVMLQSSLPAVLAGLAAAWLIERRLTHSVLPMLIPIAVAGLAVLAVLAVLGALPAFFTDTVTYTFQTFGASQALPFPWQPALLHDTSFWEASVGALWAIPMHWLLAIVAPLAAASYTGLAIWRARSRLESIPEWVPLGVIGSGLYASVLIVHMSDQNFWLSSAPTLILVAMVVKAMVAGLRARPVAGPAALGALAPLAIIYLTGLSPAVLGYALTCHTDGTGFLREVSAPSGSICTTFDAAPVVAGSVELSARHPDSAVAFMPTGPSLYQITGRVPPVPVLFLVPGVTPPAEVARTERSMRQVPVEWVVYYSVDFSKDLPAVRQLQGADVWEFDRFLRDAYQREDQDGLVVYRLKS